jgi:hypothetical protein
VKRSSRDDDRDESVLSPDAHDGATIVSTRAAEDLARLAEIAQRARAAFLEGAEEESRRRTGRPLTPDEQARVLQRYPGDWFKEPGPRAEIVR